MARGIVAAETGRPWTEGEAEESDRASTVRASEQLLRGEDVASGGTSGKLVWRCAIHSRHELETKEQRPIVMQGTENVV